MKKLYEYIFVSVLALAVVCALVFAFVSCLRSGTDAETGDETAETGGVTFPVTEDTFGEQTYNFSPLGAGKIGRSAF